jgi:dTDP-4-dehydrorhamnose reductase
MIPQKTPNKVLVLGGKQGLLGQCLMTALEQENIPAVAVSSFEVDLFSPDAVGALLDREEPDLVCNTMAYIQVDQVEDDSENAYRLNKRLPAVLAAQIKSRGALLAHYSTDFVFDGASNRPYTTQDEPNPQSVYGQSKLAGEQAILDSGLEKFLIIRTAWLFGPGKTNFVRKMLDLAAQKDSLSVIHDQTGSPTYTKDLAENSIRLFSSGRLGLFHLVNAGKATWCELAQEAVRIAGLDCRIDPIPSSSYPQKAKRPAYSVLDTSRFTEATGLTPRSWDQALRDYVFLDLESALDG